MNDPKPFRFFMTIGDRDVYALTCDHSSQRFDQEIGQRTYNGSSNAYQAIVYFPVGATPILTWESTTRELTGSYRLRDSDMESKRFPINITGADYVELDEDDQVHYVAETTARTSRASFEITGVERLPMDPGPAPELEAGLRWIPAAGHLGVFGPVGAHLYPGVLVGFDVGATIKAAGGEYYEHKLGAHSTFIESQWRLYWDPPRSTVVKTRGRKTETRPTWATREVKVPLERSWTGSNLAAALAKLDAYKAQVDEIIAEVKTVKLCSHCSGFGVTNVRESL